MSLVYCYSPNNYFPPLASTSSVSFHLAHSGLLPLPDVSQPLAWITWWAEEQVKQRYNLLGGEKCKLADFSHTDLSQRMPDEWGRTANMSKHDIRSACVCVCVCFEHWTLVASLCIIETWRNTKKHKSLSCLAGKLLFFYEGVSYWWLCCESVICSQTETTLIQLHVLLT